MIAKTGERWTPPFVLREIQENRAGLFRFHEDGKHIAYLICELLGVYGEKVLHLWIVEGSGMTRKRILEAVALIDRLAIEKGASVIRITGRSGWARALEEYFKPVAVVYERKVYV